MSGLAGEKLQGISLADITISWYHPIAVPAGIRSLQMADADSNSKWETFSHKWMERCADPRMTNKREEKPKMEAIIAFFWLWKVKVSGTQSCQTPCNPMDCSPPGFSTHGIPQASILEWVAIPFSSGSSWPRDWTQVSCTAGRFFTLWATREDWASMSSRIKHWSRFMSEDLEEITPRLGLAGPHASPSSGTPQLVQQPRESESLYSKEREKGSLSGRGFEGILHGERGKGTTPLTILVLHLPCRPTAVRVRTGKGLQGNTPVWSVASLSGSQRKDSPASLCWDLDILLSWSAEGWRD